MSEYQQYVGGEAATYEEGNEWLGEPIPVVGMSERRTPEQCGTMTWTVPTVGGTNQPVQLLPRTVHRFKAKITINTLTGTVPIISQPAVPASGVAQQNTNQFPVQVVLSGFTATQVFVNGIQVGTGNGTYTVPANGTISVTYTIAGTWAWTALTTIPGTIVFSQVIDRVQGGNPQGVMTFTPITMPYNLPDWESQQPLYAICLSGVATVSVQDERFLEKL